MSDAPSANQHRGAIDPPDPAAFLREVSSEMDAIEGALERLDRGSAGRCEICGTELDGEEIRAHPLSDRCRAHSA